MHQSAAGELHEALERLRVLRVIHDFAENLSALEFSKDTLIYLTISCIAETLKVRRASFLSLSDDGALDYTNTVLFTNGRVEPFSDDRSRVTIPRGGDRRFTIMRGFGIQRIPADEAVTALTHDIDEAIGLTPGDMLFCPLRTHGELWGMLELNPGDTGKEFSKVDILFLSTIVHIARSLFFALHCKRVRIR